MANQCLVITLIIGLTALAVTYTKSVNRVKRWADLPDTEFHFDCKNRAIGFYADMEFNCQVFHICDAFGRRVSMICPNETAFNQEYRVCDWEYNVNCPDSETFFYLNDLTYEKPPKEEEEAPNDLRK
ncbi:U-scoloptoxin(01)-Er1a-like [Oppia nitens]|uniref:U-scoloptoxin(01)-Er1a-like n=1 Tax=Oppia nitens TaxID=1686743 RepID=UPI0023DB2083|nr:U-scoloptoxin(01)-Er1a-like [Oppia nitens]